jgi:enoyl-[acyl-carrier-protein] reductase (NADH)
VKKKAIPQYSFESYRPVHREITQHGEFGYASVDASKYITGFEVYSKNGIRPAFGPIKVISPGVIDTAWWNAFPVDVKNNLFEQFASETPAGRNGKPEDIARVIIFMIEQEFITGRILQVDGGFGL